MCQNGRNTIVIKFGFTGGKLCGAWFLFIVAAFGGHLWRLHTAWWSDVLV